MNNVRKIATDTSIVKVINEIPEMIGDSRQFKFVISTADVDTSYDIVHQNWDLDFYMLNRVVLWSHSSESLPIAKCVSIGVEDGKLKATAEFATSDCNPLAEQVYCSVKAGFVSACSVGFMPIEWEETTDPDRGGGTYSAGYDYKRNLLREFSLCSVPANQYALIERAGQNIDDINKIKQAQARRRQTLELRGRIRYQGT